MAPLLELRGISATRGVEAALRDVSLSIEAGGSLGLLGRSGSGKSSLLRIVAGLDAPEKGQVLLGGAPASADGRVLIPPHRRGVAMLFQDLALWPDLTLLQNVALGLCGSGIPRRERAVRAHGALERCSVHALAHRKPAEVSGGESQRAALARAMAVEPRLLLLDEPFSSLDPVTKQDMTSRVRALTRDHGVAIVLVTHDPLEMLALCSDAVVLEAGRVVESGRVADLLRTPRSPVLCAFRDQLIRGPADGP